MKKDIDRLMRENDLAALLVIGSADHNPHMVYFTGFHTIMEADLLKITGKKPVLFHHQMERDEAAATGLKTIDYEKYHEYEIKKKYKGDRIKIRAALYLKMFADLGLTKGRVMYYGKDDSGVSHEVAQMVQKTMPGIHFVGDGERRVLMGARQTKDAGEQERIRQMGAITTRVVGRTAEFLISQRAKHGRLVKRDGSALTVGELKHHINLWLAEAGVENPEGTIFAIGRDAAIGHSSGSSSDELALGKTIVFDIFPCEQGGGYFYDFTRTWCLGYAPEDVQKLHQDVLEVHHAMVNEIKVNTTAYHYQKRTCEMFEAKGHVTVESKPGTTDGYIHSLGHGVGLDVQESPLFSATSSDRIVKGSVFTIEPGLYYPEQGMGIRIEDTYCITPKGRIECMANYPYDLVLKVRGH